VHERSPTARRHTSTSACHDNSTQNCCGADGQRDAVIAQERAHWQRIQSTRALGVPVADDVLKGQGVAEQPEDAEVLVLAHDGYNLPVPLDRASSIVRLEVLDQLAGVCRRLLRSDSLPSSHWCCCTRPPSVIDDAHCTARTV
jgi:hypothetical protein